MRSIESTNYQSNPIIIISWHTADVTIGNASSRISMVSIRSSSQKDIENIILRMSCLGLMEAGGNDFSMLKRFMIPYEQYKKHKKKSTEIEFLMAP